MVRIRHDLTLLRTQNTSCRYFGLQYTNSYGSNSWLKLDRKVSDQDIKKENTLQFQFRVKFFPENCEDEIIQSSTLTLFYLQVQ